MATTDFRFPKNFVWGVAAAATQIEGAASVDGKGESIWDRFSRIPGKVNKGDTPEVACDHYHLYRKDFALMRKMGVKNYRLSIAWPRIYPNGDGAINPKGLAFYDRLIDAMLKEGITPWVTLFHWDLPQALEDRGGWRSRLVPEAFATYADTVVATFGDRVKNWITLNEIICFTSMAYGYGDKAPGTKVSFKVLNQIYHNALLCHGHGVRAVREHGGRGARVGLTDNSAVPVPVTETPADIAAAKAWFVEKNEYLLSPVFRGEYAAAHLKRVGADRAKVERGDMELIGQPTDFFGMNIYTGVFVRAGQKGRKYEEIKLPADYPRTTCTWLNIMPQVIYWGPRLAKECYGVKKIYITENGCGYTTEPVVNGEVHDLHRRDFVRNYLKEMHRAIADGVPIGGYFLWSFMDNYEWAEGYERRFGIVHVDYKTQKRTPKLSAHWYSTVMRENRIV